MKVSAYRIKGVLFDFDGTLTLPGALDFSIIKKELGCPPSTAVLEYVDSLTDAAQHRSAEEKLAAFEMDAALVSKPHPDAEDLLQWIKEQKCPVGILTRNSRESISAALCQFRHFKEDDFDLIITREDPPAVKPSGDGIRWAAEQWQAVPGQILMVGDFLFDIQAGLDADALTALIDPDQSFDPVQTGCDFYLRDLNDLKFVIQEGLPLSAGKLPNEILQRYLNEFDFQDASVIVSSGVGEDTAAIDVTDTEVLVLKSDPITFATDAIGQYAVSVNANDIATSGGVPRWLLTTLLMPCGTSGSQVRVVMQELAETCSRNNITLCGGHTELTDAVNRPIVVGMMAGTVGRDSLIEKSNLRPGDKVVATKSAGVEGTAIIAREFAARLVSMGFTADEITRCQRFLDRISILPEARLAADKGLAVAMHDVTEGGLATALEELSTAGGHKIVIEMDQIPVFDLTRKICEALNLNPLGLIGSGCLLICCRPENCSLLVDLLADHGVSSAVIGEVRGPGHGIDAVQNGRPVKWPRFAVDEITRLFSQ